MFFVLCYVINTVRPYFLHIILLMLCVPLPGFTQSSLNPAEFTFYVDLAEKDAQHEQQALLQLSPEDESDFWADQEDFEAELLATHPAAYRVYLDAKGRAYRKHQLHSGEVYRQRSEEFLRHATFYMIKGQLNEEVVYANEGKRYPPK